MHWKEAVDKEVKNLIDKGMLKRAVPGTVFSYFAGPLGPKEY